MALTALDLLAPSAGGTGEITPELALAVKPSAASASAALSGFIAAAESKTAGITDPVFQRSAAVAWAHVLAFRARAQQILSASLSKGADGASVSYAVGQAQELNKAADRWQAIYVATVAESSGAVAVPASPRASRSLLAEIGW